MRKIICLVALLSLLLAVCGCSKFGTQIQGNDTTSSDNHTEDTAPNETNDNFTAIRQIPMISASMPIITQTAVSKDNSVLLKSIYQNLSLITQDPEVADKIIIDYLNMTDMSSSGSGMLAQAESAYKEVPDKSQWSPYLQQFTFDTMRIDHGLFSLFGTNVTYSGGIHADTVGRSITYDLISGQPLSLSDIFTDSFNTEYVCSLVLKALSSQESLFTGYKSTVSQRFDKDFLKDEDWFFSNTGLCFFFSPYEIAPYSSGIIFAEIPYAKLSGIMQDKYFPAERENASGSVQISPFDENSLQQYSQFTEVVLDAEAEKFLLHSQHGVYDVRIEIGSWSADGLTYIPEHTVLACYALTPGDAVMLEANLSAALPKLRLRYTTNEQTVSFFLVKDELTGSITLNPA